MPKDSSMKKMKTNVWKQQMGAAAKHLKVDFDEKADAFEQNLDRGKSREGALSDFLADQLPTRYSIGEGEVLDSSGGVSDSQDIVIYDNTNVPLLVKSDTGPQKYFAESVYGSIQVKTKLTTPEFESAIENIASVRRLNRQASVHKIGAMTTSTSYKPFGCIFARTGVDPMTMFKVWAEVAYSLEPHVRPNLCCILDCGIFTYYTNERGSASVGNEADAVPVFLQSEESALMFFYLAMTEYMGQLASVQTVGLTQYASGYKYLRRFYSGYEPPSPTESVSDETVTQPEDDSAKQ